MGDIVGSLKAATDPINKMPQYVNQSQQVENLDSTVIQVTKIYHPLNCLSRYKHSALLVDSISKNLEQNQHIIEYLDGHRIRTTQVNQSTQNQNYFRSDDDIVWTIEGLVGNRYFENLTVNQIRSLMIQQANEYGNYDVQKNNCNIVASKVFNRIRNCNQIDQRMNEFSQCQQHMNETGQERQLMGAQVQVIICIISLEDQEMIFHKQKQQTYNYSKKKLLILVCNLITLSKSLNSNIILQVIESLKSYILY
ncbi:hypothetical protein pb186bvf_015286 [Paramecium bursaria]